jgi:bis(5'-nucleosidyl)-tetraphosphatase
MEDERRAAGFVLFHEPRSPRGEGPRFLLLRNARHKSWGFPKGHAEPGEDDLATARRETLEETGIASVEVHPEFRAEVRYPVRTAQGVAQKTVVYFLARTASPRVKRSSEHDQAVWATEDEAAALLGFENLRDVLIQAAAAVEDGTFDEDG